MSVLWPYAPNRLAETLEFSTDIRTARDAEIRDSLKDATRKMDIGLTLPHRDAEQAIMLYNSNPLGTWIVPIWPEWSVGGSLSIADDVITCDTDASYRVGGFVFIGNSISGEVGEIASIAPGELTLVDGVASAWSSPMIAPAEVCFFPDGVQVNKAFPVTDIDVSVLSIEPIDVADSSFPTHGGYTVVTDPSVLTAPLSGNVQQALQLLDSRMGIYALGRAESYIRRRSMLQFTDQQNRWQRRQFIHFMRGRDASFWVPTWQDDLPLQSSVLSGATTITVQKLAPAPTLLVGRAIQIKLPDGTLIHRTVSAASTLLDTHVLTIAAPGVAVPQASKVSLMTLYRSDSDIISLTHEFSVGGLVTSFSIPVVEVLA